MINLCPWDFMAMLHNIPAWNQQLIANINKTWQILPYVLNSTLSLDAA